MSLLTPYIQSVCARHSAINIVDLMLQGVPATTARAYAQALRSFAHCAGVHPESYRHVAAEWLAQDAVTRNRAAQGFVDGMRGAGIKPSTIQCRLAALRRLLQTAVFHGLADGVLTVDRLPSVEHSFDGRDAQLATIRAVREELASHEHLSRRLRDTALLSLLYPTGVRIGGMHGDRRSGILGIDIEDVDTDTLRIYLKGKTAAHEIRPDAQTMKDLHAWQQFRQVDTGPLFVGIDRHGVPSGERLLQQTVRNLLRKLGTEGRCNPHSFRHAVATTMLRQTGATLADVRDQLGHSSLRTAERYVSYKDRSAGVGVGEGLRGLMRP